MYSCCFSRSFVRLVRHHTRQESPLCPDAPPIQKRIIEHIFDAYVDKLPDQDFGVQPPPRPENIASDDKLSPSSSSTEKHHGTEGNRCAQERPPSLRRELSRFAEGVQGGRDSGEGISIRKLDLAGDGRNNFSGTSGRATGDAAGGVTTEPLNSSFLWVPSDEGEAGPHTSVAARNVEWSAVARDVRFRLSSAWLSCDQVK